MNDESPITESKSNKDPHMLGTLCHLLSLTLFIGVPFGNLLGPFVLWSLKRAEDPYLNEVGKEVLNFQISVTLYAIICGILFITFIGIVLLPVVLMCSIVLTIVAALKSSEGVFYSYPLTIRFLK
jgi:uncharacterized Tic20 family protein